MASKKRLSDSLVVNLLQQMLDSQNETREALSARLDAIVAEQHATNERLDRFEKAVVGVGRMTSLEDRVRRIEARIGIVSES